MRRGVVMAGIAILAALLLAAPAGAITYGTPDGNRHPQVGALLAPQPYSDGTWAACSGTLIAPTVFLTAAHCDLEVDRVAVTFDSSYDPATGTEHWGTWHADPDYTQAQNDPHDIAVVVLDQAVTGITPARLPAAGSLDSLRVGTRFTSVGYGAQSVTIDHGPSFHYADVRYVATGGLLAVNPSWLRISMNPARRRHLLWRLGRAELPRRRRIGDQRRGRHHHHRRRHVPGHQRRLPPGHRLGAGIPRPVRRPSLAIRGPAVEGSDVDLNGGPPLLRR